MLIRPIHASDRSNYRSILDRTSSEDRYCRFFRVVDHVDEAEIARFCEPTADMFGLIALDDAGRALGTIHAVTVDRPVAEMAIVVARDARHRGVASRLLRALLDDLQARGFAELVAHALPSNYGFNALAKATGMTVAGSSDAALTWRYDLQSHGDAAAATPVARRVPPPAPSLRLNDYEG